MPKFTPAALAAGTLVALAASSASAQLTITDSADAQTLAAAFSGEGVTIVPGSATLIGSGNDDGLQQGLFSSTDTSLLGLSQGVILSTGLASNILGPNNSSGLTANLGTDGDADLSALAGGDDTNDANVLSFNFTVAPNVGGLTFSYVFASEEYNSFVGSSFNDVFGFFVDGQNVALLPDGNIVSINNINGGNGNDETDPGDNEAAVNPQLYRNNDPFDPDGNDNLVANPINLQADGLTVVLTADVLAALDPTLSVHSIALKIADNTDGSLDSWVLLGADSFSIPEPTSLSLLAAGGLGLLRRRR